MGCDTPEEGVQGYLWLVGVFCSIFGSFLTSCGNILSKIAQEEQIKAEKKYREPIPGIVLSPKWIFATLLVGIIPLPVEMAALALATQSLIAPTAGSSLFFSQFLGSWFMDEKVTKYQYLASGVVVIGIGLTTVFGEHASISYTLQDLKDLWKEPTTIAVASFGFGSIILGNVFVFSGKAKVLGRFEIILFAYIGGAIGSFSNVFLKGVSELFGNLQDFSNDPGIALLWVFVTCVFAIGQVSYLNQGLKKYPVTVFAPLYTAMLVLNSVVQGGTYYQEFGCFDTKSWILFFFGLLVSLSGICALALLQAGDIDESSVSHETLSDENVEGKDNVKTVGSFVVDVESPSESDK